MATAGFSRWSNEFFYWLRASVLETNRVAYWWANRMLTSPRPLQRKDGALLARPFAVNEAKVRDYRKLLDQLQLFEKPGHRQFPRPDGGRWRRIPAMLTFLDAGVNVKGAANENFAREIMEMFTMGVGHYTEKDIREAARAFTGWNYVDLKFVVNKDQHDDGEKTFLGKTGRFDGVNVIDIIMQQPATADFIAGKIYRYFVREDLSPELQKQAGLGAARSRLQIAPLLETIFLSRDFYSPASVGTQIKSPVRLAVSTYRKLGLEERSRRARFQRPPRARWASGCSRRPRWRDGPAAHSWITPGLLLERANFGRDVLFPDINFLPPDRFTGDPEVRRVADRIRAGHGHQLRHQAGWQERRPGGIEHGGRSR